MTKTEEELAKEHLIKIFNQDSTLFGEYISQEFRNSEKAVVSLEGSLNKSLMRAFENLESSQKLVKEQEIKRRYVEHDLEKLIEANNEFGWATQPIIKKLVVLRKNLREGIETFHDFLDVRGQAQNLRDMIQDHRYYMHIQEKIKSVTLLKRGIQSKSSKNPKMEKAYKKFLEVFQEFENISTEFYDTLIGNVSESLEIVELEPIKLARTLKVLEDVDELNSDSKMFELSKKSLVKMAKRRFQERLQDSGDNINEKLEVAKFSVSDQIQVFQKLQPIFPKKFEIFKFLQSVYQNMLEELVLPYLEDLSVLKENPGLVVILIGWLDEYKALLEKAGMNADSISDLHTKVKGFIPVFMTHIEQLLKEWTSRILKLNEEDKSKDNLEDMIANGEPLETPFPEDLFKFFNEQVFMLAEKLHGELFLRVVSIWGNHLNDFFMEKAQSELKYQQQQGQEDQADVFYRVSADLNDFNRCVLHIADIKTEIKDLLEPEFHERVDKQFQQAAKGLQAGIAIEVDFMVKCLLNKIQESVIHSFFSVDWLEQELALAVLDALETQLKELDEWIVNSLHVMKLFKGTLILYVDLYLERFLLVASRVVSKPSLDQGYQYTALEDSGESNVKDKKKISKMFNKQREEVIQKLEGEYKAFERVMDGFKNKISPSLIKKLKMRLQNLVTYYSTEVKKLLSEIENPSPETVDSFTGEELALNRRICYGMVYMRGDIEKEQLKNINFLVQSSYF